MLIGGFFGVMGLLLAVPILTALVVLDLELWVRPTELRTPGLHGAESAAHEGAYRPA